ncbi:protein kinase [Sorangium sp. So ce1036]|uniref:serine/threonine-protein kinase n=1 Tax=Sorangium sp. So ce1036 TaxID=3133328 RepID=UPI003EFF38F4
MTLYAGRYETVRAIASGGMATVYLGRAVGAGGFERLVALKMMHPHLAEEPEFVAMFLDEARLAARVRHPNVVATFDLVEDPLFLVMEYVEGPSLHHLLRTCARARRPVPLGIALRVFLDMLAGLHAAHELTGPGGEPLHLVHRDVSPQNVIVGVDGVTRITDFGVARAESRLVSTRGNALKGKLAYMAPEQIRAEQADRRSDVYSAGVVLWEMLTEQRLFKADNEGALIAQILEGAPAGPRAVMPSVPVALDRICLRALRADRDERFPTADAFADALEEAAANTPGLAVASHRAVEALLKEVGLHASPDPLAGSPISARSGPASSSAPRSLRAPLSQRPPRSQRPPLGQPSPLSQRGTPLASGGAGADTSTPGLGAVVSEAALQRQRQGLVRRSLIATLFVLPLALGVGAFLVRSGRDPAGQEAGPGGPGSPALSLPLSSTADRMPTPPMAPVQATAPSPGPAPTASAPGPAPTASAPGSAPTASAPGSAPGAPGSASAAPGPSSSAPTPSAANKPRTGPSQTRAAGRPAAPTKPAPRTSTVRSTSPKAPAPKRTRAPRTKSWTPFRPTEL